MVRTPVCGTGSCGFESHHSPTQDNTDRKVNLLHGCLEKERMSVTLENVSELITSKATELFEQTSGRPEPLTAGEVVAKLTPMIPAGVEVSTFSWAENKQIDHVDFAISNGNEEPRTVRVDLVRVGLAVNG